MAATKLASDVHIADAARQGRLDLIQAAVKTGTDPNARCPRNGSTPLIAAAGKGHVHVVKYLLGLGVEVDHENDDGASAADAALAMGH